MLTNIVTRIIHHPKTTITGGAVAGIVWYLLGSFHCQLPGNAVDWAKWTAVAGPAVLGMLSKD